MLTAAIVVIVLVVAFLGYAATRPDTFHMERSAAIQAPPEKVLPLIGDFHNWSAWSPWEKLDPALKRSYSGPASGKGAVYEYEGNKKVGQGRMEILRSDPGGVEIKLDFLKPFEAHNTARFTLRPQGSTTNVKWEMFGPSPFISKLMGIFFNMDKMIGKDFESGLAAMKTAAEK